MLSRRLLAVVLTTVVAITALVGAPPSAAENASWRIMESSPVRAGVDNAATPGGYLVFAAGAVRPAPGSPLATRGGGRAYISRFVEGWRAAPRQGTYLGSLGGALQEGWERAAFAHRYARAAGEGFEDLARFRAGLGLEVGEGTLARLEVGGRRFYGINAHGQPITLRVNAITRTHAEADAFQQAFNAGARGGTGRLFVDRGLCPACGLRGGVRGLARQLGLERLEVFTPDGLQVILP